MPEDLRSAILAATESTPVESPSSDPAPAPLPEPSAPAAAPADAPAAAPVASSPDASATTPASEPAAAGATGKPEANIEEVLGEGKPADATPPANETAEQREQRQRVDRPPQSWKGESKKLWEQLPLQVRQEVARREREMHIRLQESAQDRQKVQSIVEVMTPHRSRIETLYGGNPINAIDALLRTEAILASGTTVQKAQLVAHLIKNFGVDIASLDSALAGVAPPAETQQQSQIEQLLEQKLAPLQEFIQQQQEMTARQRQEVQQTATLTVQQMAEDVATYPYFEEVREEMADIIEMASRRGVAVSLEQAYHRAVRMNDDVFKASSTREQQHNAQQAALQAHRAAQAAKGASVSVSGSPAVAGKQTSIGDPSDLRGTIAAAFGGDRV